MKIHFIGIGGISMSGLAHVCINLGYEVSGSDKTMSSSLQKLINEGATVYIGHDESQLSIDTDLVVYTAAVKEDNPELSKARKLNLNIIDRAQFLGDIMKKYENSIAIAGTHGKTTTTSMTTVVFNANNEDPTVLVGGNLSVIGGNVRIGDSEVFITEACEYVDSFLKFYPKIAIILNLEEDHLDYFSGLEQIQTSFAKFASQVKQDGYIIANGDDENIIKALENVDKTKIYFGRNENCQALIHDEIYNPSGYATFSLSMEGKSIGRFTLQVPGKHNVLNATAAILSAYVSNLPLTAIKDGIESYSGVGRRFEYKGEVNGIKVYDDYAHHPTEVAATLSAAKMIKHHILYTVFQPHTYTRTKELLDRFAVSFQDSDVVIISDIYASREKDPGNIHSRDLVEAIKKSGKDALYLGSLDEVQNYLGSVLKPEDIVFTIGAGDVYTLGESLLHKSKL